MTCACGRPAIHKCGRALEDPRIFMPHEVKALDFVQHPAALTFHVARSVSYGPGRDMFYILLEEKGETAFRATLPVLVMTVEPCGRALCEACAVDLGDDRHYMCPDHWAALGPEPESVYSAD